MKRMARIVAATQQAYVFVSGDSSDGFEKSDPGCASWRHNCRDVMVLIGSVQKDQKVVYRKETWLCG